MRWLDPLKNRFFAWLIVGMLSFAIGPSLVRAQDPTAAGAKPNVLIFFIDDLGRCDVGVDGSTFHETPKG